MAEGGYPYIKTEPCVSTYSYQEHCPSGPPINQERLEPGPIISQKRFGPNQQIFAPSLPPNQQRFGQGSPPNQQRFGPGFPPNQQRFRPDPLSNQQRYAPGPPHHHQNYPPCLPPNLQRFPCGPSTNQGAFAPGPPCYRDNIRQGPPIKQERFESDPPPNQKSFEFNKPSNKEPEVSVKREKYNVTDELEEKYHSDDLESPEYTMTAFVSGFPADLQQREIEDFFFVQLSYLEIRSIVIRRFPNKTFKGSVFVTFWSKNGLSRFLCSGNFFYGPCLLFVQSKTEFIEFKNQQKELKKRRRMEAKRIKQAGEIEKIKSAMTPASILHITIEHPDSKQNNPLDNTQGNEDQGQNSAFFTGVTTSSLPTIAMMKEYFGQFSPVAWVEYTNGDTKAYIRFKEKFKAWEVNKNVKELGDKAAINGCRILSIKVLCGDEEIDKWRDILQRKDRPKMAQIRKNANNDTKRRRRDIRRFMNVTPKYDSF